MSERGTIVAMGGGGFLMEPENPLLDDFVLGCSGVARPRVCLLPTGGGDAEDVITRFHAAFPDARAVATHLSLFRQTGVDPRAHLLAQDVIYVSGGNTVNMLAVWRVHGVDEALREAWHEGVVLAGVSAGAICWFEHGLTDSHGPAMAPMRALGWLPGTMCPHYDGEIARRPRLRSLVDDGTLPPALAADDGAALVFRGRALSEVVSSRPGAAAYRVEPGAETRLPARYLGSAR